MNRNYFSAVSYILIFFAVIFAVSGALVPYSYWWDELYSVAGASLSIGDMFSMLILKDVHPPAYHMALHYWISLFGKSEISTRILSILVALLSLAAFMTWASRRLGQPVYLFATVFFATSFLFSYYAQEARPYSMMLCFSTLLTVSFLECSAVRKSTASFIATLAAAVLLSLVHFFGLIYAGIILIFTLYLVRDQVSRVIAALATCALCLVWPVWHFLAGGLKSKTGGRFWIESNGIETTLAELANGLVPHLAALKWFLAGSDLTLGTALIMSICLAAIAGAVWIRNANGLMPKANPAVLAATIFFCFLVSVIAIDYHTPISNYRNFIVLLPSFSILVGYFVVSIVRNKNALALVLVLCIGVSNLLVSYISLSNKQRPLQNHKSAVAFVELGLSKTPAAIAYFLKVDPAMPEMNLLAAKLYFQSAPALVGIDINDISSLKPPFYLLMQHQSYRIEKILSEFRKSGIDAKSFEPKQNSTSTVVVVYAE